jgi:hypothetical protein
VFWITGEVSRYDGAPAWAVNEPPPDPYYVQKDGGFCVAVKSLMERHAGVTIPNPYGDEAWDGGTLSTYVAHFDDSYWYSTRRSMGFRDGDVLVSPFVEGVSQGHVGVVYQGYVIEWIVNGGLVWRFTPEESNEWGQYEIVVPVEVWLGKDSGGNGTGSKPTPREYPGDCADPDEVARWMAYVAEREYGLPPVLPIMTSVTELTDAWTGPGCVYNVDGYLNNVDYDSYGYFQQRPSQGWGSYAQVTNADYALRRFCESAAAIKDWEWNQSTTDPDVLGRWCQTVQGSAHPDKYRDKGYPMAMQLLKGYDPTDKPDPKPEEEGDMELAKYTFVAVGQPATDFCNAAVATLEAHGVEAMAINGEANIRTAGAQALGYRGDKQPNVIVAGEAAYECFGETSKNAAGWEVDSVIWWHPQGSDADVLGFVHDWVIWWISEYGENGEYGEKPMTAWVDGTFPEILSAFPKGAEYMRLLNDSEIEPPPPPPVETEEIWVQAKNMRDDDTVLVRRKKEKTDG